MLLLNSLPPKSRVSKWSLDSFSKPSFSIQPSILFPDKSRLERSLNGRNKEAFKYHPPEPGSTLFQSTSSVTRFVVSLHQTPAHLQQSASVPQGDPS
uniref:Uncharacterized protein n=1 Tax=Rhizophora mucronata TaxID=61149 RepID=A0A2P2MR11_RHIMU